MQVNPEKMLSIILEGQEEGLSTEEICRKHGIKRHTYYAWRRKLTWAGLELLSRQRPNSKEPLADKVQKLRHANISLGQKVRRLEKAKAMWELRCKWLWWQLDAVNDPAFQEQLTKIREQVPLKTEFETGERETRS